MTDNYQIISRIEFHDVSLAFDDQVVLDNVSFTVAPGEMKLMLGESGGGKSMILKLGYWCSLNLADLFISTVPLAR